MDLEQERKIWDQGFNVVAGIDESGRGPVAGPVTAAAVAMTGDYNYCDHDKLQAIKGSKQLSEKQRSDFYDLINECSWLKWATSRVGPKVIDKINILKASKLAMKRAVTNLNKKMKKKVDFLLVDGNFSIDSDASQKSIIKGDQKVFLVAAASVMAKVSRDRAMKRYDKMYPDYDFAQNKGYPTAFHRNKVKEKGPCEIHRRTFKPVKFMVQ